MRHRTFVGCFFLLLVACQQVPQRPLEPLVITIRNVDRRTLAETIVASRMGQPDATLRLSNEYQIVIGYRMRSGNALLYGSRYDPYPEARITYTMANVSGGVQLSVTAAMVTNPGSSMERVTDVTRANHQDLRRELDAISAAFH